MKTLYVIHGWTYTIEPWTKTVEILRSRGIEVRQLRVPGLTSPSDKVWTIDDYVEWLRGELAGVEQPIVLGHSNGGRISLNYLVKYPGSFKHLVLLNSAGVYDRPGRVSMKRRVFRVLAKALAPLKHVPYAKKIVYRLLKSDYNQAPENMKQTLHNMLESDKQLDITKVTTPVSILWGKEDATTPIGMGRKMHDLLPSSTIAEFDDWKHAPYLTHPEQLADEISAIMERV